MAWGWQIVFSGILQNRTSAKLVLLRICDRADSDGICWPGHGKTAKELRFSKTTVKESIKLFEELNLLHKKHRRSEEGDPSSNLYILHLDFIPPHSPHLETEQGGGSASAPPRSASAPGVGQPAPQGGALSDPEPKIEPTKKQQQQSARARVDAGAAAAKLNKKDKENKALRIVHCVHAWNQDDVLVTLALAAQHGIEAVQAAAKTLQNQGIAPLPGRVAQELQRRAGAAAAASAAAAAEARAARIDAQSRERAERDIAELMAIQRNQQRQESDP